MILLVAALAVFAGLAMRARWEDLVAFVGGPAMLLVLMTYANRSLKTAPEPDAATPAITSASAQAAQTPGLTGWALLLWLCVILLALAATLYGRSPLLAGLAGTWAHLRGHRQRGTRAKRSGGANSTLYFTTAVKLGAQTAAADGLAEPREFKALQSVFSLNEATCPDAKTIYDSQLQRPEGLSVVIRPFLKAYGHGSAIAETLVFGMTCVALADGVMSAAELGVIRMAADLLGLPPRDTSRILMSAGYLGAHQRRRTSSGTGQRSQSAHNRTSQPLSERERYLQTLGLQSGADANTIRKAWRNLARKYHPDKLVSQNLPPEEMERAETMMQSINEAYDWLKEHGG